MEGFLWDEIFMEILFRKDTSTTFLSPISLPYEKRNHMLDEVIVKRFMNYSMEFLLLRTFCMNEPAQFSIFHLTGIILTGNYH